MTTGPGAIGLLWLWATVADHGRGDGLERPSRAAAELPPRIAAPAPRQIAGVTLPSPRSWPPDPAVLPPGKWFR